VPDVADEVLCGAYDVPEDRSSATGRRIGLRIVVLPATKAPAALDPLVFLAGGGVAPATRYAGFLSKAFSHLRQQRDILLVDQRGTGGSNALECDVPTDPASPVYRDEGRFVDAVRRCREEVEHHADPRFYTTPIAMDDLDEVRGWLGYPSVNLYAASYGTRAAMAYVRQHREHVRTIALQGVVPVDVPMWLEVPRSSQEALERVFTTCAQQPRCHDAFPDLAARFDSLLKRLAEQPARLKLTPPRAAKEREVVIDDVILRAFVFRTLSSASDIGALPLLIHLADTGNYGPLAERIATKDEGSIPKGIYFSIVCSEDVPLFEPGALPAAAAGTFMGVLRVGRDVLACREWVRGWLPQGFTTPVASDVPALIMNGGLDHLTPPRYGEHVAQALTRARRLVLPNRGHNDVDPCVASIVEAFVTNGDPAHVETGCLANTEPLSFALRVEDLED
jgi:pimeloyl-ACP methyl ester carboxylesterase